jgi:hypothetical protein
MASWISRMFGKSRANTATSKPDVAAAHQALVEGAALSTAKRQELIEDSAYARANAQRLATGKPIPRSKKRRPALSRRGDLRSVVGRRRSLSQRLPMWALVARRAHDLLLAMARTGSSNISASQ